VAGGRQRHHHDFRTTAKFFNECRSLKLIVVWRVGWRCFPPPVGPNIVQRPRDAAMSMSWRNAKGPLKRMLFAELPINWQFWLIQNEPSQTHRISLTLNQSN